jgi:hypothetical protein
MSEPKPEWNPDLNAVYESDMAAIIAAGAYEVPFEEEAEISETRGLHIVPNEPDAPPLQGSVSAPVSALGKASAPLRECPFCGDRAIVEKIHEWDDAIAINCNNGDCRASQWHHPDYPFTEAEAREAWNRRDGEAARVAEAVAAAVLEREREIVAVIAGLPTHSDRTGRRMISWFDVQMILRGIESEAAAGPQGDAP